MGSGGLSDHFPIFLEFRNGPIKPQSPLKFNKSLLKDSSFQTLVTTHWTPFNPNSRILASFQFAANIHKLKDVVKTWASEEKKTEGL